MLIVRRTVAVLVPLLLIGGFLVGVQWFILGSFGQALQGLLILVGILAGAAALLGVLAGTVVLVQYLWDGKEDD